jgi:hypothetical protein
MRHLRKYKILLLTDEKKPGSLTLPGLIISQEKVT